jgi:ABC-type multidrug transport system fused ATPase/permease subunit
MALLDMIGVASILPFVAVAANPNLIETNAILSYFFQYSKQFGVENIQQFMIVLGLVVFILLLFSLTFKAITTYFSIRFVQMREYSIGKRLVEGYLRQPYSWYLNKHSAELGKNILSEVGVVINTGLRPVIDLMANSMVTIFIVILLVIIDPKLLLIVLFSLGLAYGLIYKFTSTFLKKLGRERTENNQLRFLAINEAFGAIKEIKVGGLEKKYIERFSDSAQIFASSNSYALSIEQIPRFILEAIAFGGIMLLLIYLMSQTGNFNTALPIISLYVFAGYRLMPALQMIYRCITLITFSRQAVNSLVKNFKELENVKFNQDEKILLLKKNIILKNIHLSYPNTSKKALKDINLVISSKTTVGLMGATGSGKTSMIDIILGLLEPQEGTFEVDGNLINKKNLRSWQRSIGYVPQHIYLADDTVAANIAFGLDPENINQKKVEEAAKLANLHSFVNEQLPNKYQTKVGERGIRLSGGERQRIGIARALYGNPQLLILDEATSALDNKTESAIMDAVNSLRKDITIIIIAHRLSTLKICDKILEINKGEIVSQGKFEEMV